MELMTPILFIKRFKKLLPGVSAVFCISEVARGLSFMDPVPWSVILMRGQNHGFIFNTPGLVSTWVKDSTHSLR